MAATAAAPPAPAWPAVLATDAFRDRISAARVLAVGAGGIGCELLKTLVLTGFRRIDVVRAAAAGAAARRGAARAAQHAQRRQAAARPAHGPAAAPRRQIDLDTIETSNLNRQFLFRRAHVGQSKAAVAADVVRGFAPQATITAYQANIKEPRFGVDFFSGFDIVLNGLDNMDARRHVNRLCVAAGVPLVESGTAGYVGQVSVHVKGSTECYECTPRGSGRAKSYPICTLRNTPDKPIHCVVWAKELLFPRLFGKVDVSDLDEGAAAAPTATAALEPAANGAAANGAAANGGGAANGGDADADAAKAAAAAEAAAAAAAEAAEAASFFQLGEGEEPLAYAVRVFERLYCTDIQKVLTMEELWKARAPPTPLALASLLPDPGAAVAPAAGPAPPGAGVHRALGLRDQGVWAPRDAAAVFLASIVAFLTRRRAELGAAAFDKDDALAVDFVTAASNLRAACYGIPQQSAFEAKGMAGNIIHAIATTNAVVSGLIVVEALKLLAGCGEQCSTSFLRTEAGWVGSKRTGRMRGLIYGERPSGPRAECMVCGKAQLRLAVNTRTMTLGGLVDKVLKQRLAINVPNLQTEAGFWYEEGDDLEPDEAADSAAHLPKALAALPGGGLVGGTILSVTDQSQAVSLEIIITHQEAFDPETCPEGFTLDGSAPAAKPEPEPEPEAADAGGGKKRGREEEAQQQAAPEQAAPEQAAPEQPAAGGEPAQQQAAKRRKHADGAADGADGGGGTSDSPLDLVSSGDGDDGGGVVRRGRARPRPRSADRARPEATDAMLALSSRAAAAPCRRLRPAATPPRAAAATRRAARLAPPRAAPERVEAAQAVEASPFLDPLARSLILGVGAGVFTELGHALSLAASGALPSPFSSGAAQQFSPAFFADHAVAIGAWVLLYAVEAAAIMGVIRANPDRAPEAAAAGVRGAGLLPRRLFPASLSPVRDAVAHTLAASAAATSAAAPPAHGVEAAAAAVLRAGSVSEAAAAAPAALTAAPPGLSRELERALDDIEAAAAGRSTDGGNGGDGDADPGAPRAGAATAPRPAPPAEAPRAAPAGLGVAGLLRERERDTAAGRRARELAERKAYLKNFWYAAALSSNVTSDKPLGVDILGSRISLFRDEAGQVVALDDACPHRGAPLSAGWVTTDKATGKKCATPARRAPPARARARARVACRAGAAGDAAPRRPPRSPLRCRRRTAARCVSCPYHGWAFDATGRLRDVPSADRGSWPRRPLLGSYAVQERGGFVWLFYGPPSLPAEERPPIPFTPELEDPAWRAVYGEIEFEAGHWGVFENAIDMAHIHYLHGDSFGNADKPQVMGMATTRDTFETACTFRIHNKPVNRLWEWTSVPSVPVVARAMLPSTSSVAIELAHGVRMITFVNTVPISENRAINRFCLIRNFATSPAFDFLARDNMFKILGEDKVMVDRLAPERVAQEFSLAPDVPQIAFRALRQEWVDMGYAVPPAAAAAARSIASAVEATLEGRDSLLILPTGGGKSMTFQLPPLARGDCFTVVVGPLMALAQDQVEACLELGIDARLWNSSTSDDARRAVLSDLASDAPELRLLYTTPESLKNPTLRSYLKEAYAAGTLLSFAIDEAHCVAEWGHDFRPSYLELCTLKTDFPDTPIAAVTASCTAAVEASVMQQLRMRDPLLIKGGFNRPNIEYKVAFKELISEGTQDAAVEHLADFIRARPGQCGIVYARLRATCDWLSSTLSAADLDVGTYHAGKDAARRRKVQSDWASGALDVVCATIAFGLGIDKATVRWVVHWDAPSSLEGFYQESGRAGRDGLPSESLMLVSADDLDTLAKLSRRSGAAAAVAGFACLPGCKRRRLLDFFGQKRGACDAAQEQLCDYCAAPAATRRLQSTWEEQLSRKSVAHTLRENQQREARGVEQEQEQEQECGAGAGAAQQEEQQQERQPGRVRAGAWYPAAAAAAAQPAARGGVVPARQPLGGARPGGVLQPQAAAGAAGPGEEGGAAAAGRGTPTAAAGVRLPAAGPALVPQLARKRPARLVGGGFKAPRLMAPAAGGPQAPAGHPGGGEGQEQVAPPPAATATAAGSAQGAAARRLGRGGPARAFVPPLRRG
ncbi:SAE2 [Scenedesmus sp. PABB004]|nr:SAE2 [Scenedesmus sp. PABB004]